MTDPETLWARNEHKAFTYHGAAWELHGWHLRELLRQLHTQNVELSTRLAALESAQPLTPPAGVQNAPRNKANGK